MAICIKFPGGDVNYCIAQRRIQTMWWLFVSHSQVDCNFEALEEVFEQMMAVHIKFPCRWQFWSPRRRIRKMWRKFVWSSQVDGNFEVPGEGFEQCDSNSNEVPSWTAISKLSETDSNDVAVIHIKFPGGDGNFKALSRERFEYVTISFSVNWWICAIFYFEWFSYGVIKNDHTL